MITRLPTAFTVISSGLKCVTSKLTLNSLSSLLTYKSQSTSTLDVTFKTDYLCRSIILLSVVGFVEHHFLVVLKHRFVSNLSK